MRQYKTKVFRCIIAVSLIFSLVWCNAPNFYQHKVYAVDENANVGRYVVFTGQQNIRDYPVTGKVIATASKGERAMVLGQQMLDKIWYKVQYQRDGKTTIGWTSSLYAELEAEDAVIVGDAVASTTAEDYVKAGFPLSYATKLVELAKQYPEWKFIPVNTGLDWNTVVDKESITGRSLVEKWDDDSHKSTSSDAYNWYNNTWYIKDGNNWVAASKEYVAYRLDPRNYLDQVHVFSFESLSYDQNQTLEGVKSILSKTFMAEPVADTNGSTLDYADAFYKIGKDLGVSPYHLASRVAQEQGRGQSELISGTYPGYENYFNYFNIGAFNVDGGDAVTNGLAKAKENGWNTRYSSIEGGAKIISKSYILAGQDTLYFEKFNVTNKNSLFVHQYMTNVSAVYSESEKVQAGYADKHQAFVFKIPVYRNMPENAVEMIENGNPNNYLKALSISGINMTPTFDGAKTSYSAVVGSEVSTVKISASAVAGTSSVSGVGTYNLTAGNNVIGIKCTAQNGSERTYTITINRQTGAGENSSNEETYSISSDSYKIGNFLTGIAPQTNSSDFISKFNAVNCELKILNADGSEQTGTVGTGNKLVVYSNGILMKTYDIVLYGDVNGDGKISLMDLVRLNRYSNGIVSLNGAYLEAGDVNRKSDGITLLDLVALNRYLIGNREIQQ